MRQVGDRDVVLIDDARLFGTDSDYPTVSDIVQWTENWRPGATVRVEHDAIVVEDSP